MEPRFGEPLPMCDPMDKYRLLRKNQYAYPNGWREKIGIKAKVPWNMRQHHSMYLCLGNASPVGSKVDLGLANPVLGVTT